MLSSTSGHFDFRTEEPLSDERLQSLIVNLAASPGVMPHHARKSGRRPSRARPIMLAHDGASRFLQEIFK